MPNNGEAQVNKERGRALATGISYKCRIGHHKDCTAMKCECTECDHGISENTETKEAA